MIKKIILITLFLLFAGILIAGGITRTTARNAQEARSDRIANGKNGTTASADEQQPGIYEGQEQGKKAAVQAGPKRQGQGNQGGGDYGGGQSRQYQQTRVYELGQETITITGAVNQVPAAGIDLLLQTAEGEILIGTGPGYLDEQGFALALGEEIEVSGFWEDEEFKAQEITRLTDGSSIILRNEFGRPMWSGAVRNGRGQGSQGYERSSSTGSTENDS